MPKDKGEKKKKCKAQSVKVGQQCLPGVEAACPG